jgi:hypothetical protein
MTNFHNLLRSVALLLVLTVFAVAQPVRPGTEEFGLTQKELVQAIEKVESHIADCMRKQGFEYVPADYKTVRRGMISDKSLPGMDEDAFIEAYGFGISTLYTGKAPQLNDGYSPGRIGLGLRNVEIFKGLSPADQAAYNRALLGDHIEVTFAVALEREDFSRCGGCTLEAIKQVFKPEQLTSSYYNPKDALVNKHPKMRAALKKYSEKMRAAGFDYQHPDDVEADIHKRFEAIIGNSSEPVEKLSADQQAALKKLQEYERRVAKVGTKLQEEIFDPVEEEIQKELYPRKVE